MIDKQIIDEMIEKIGFDVQQCGYLKITKDALNYPEIGGTFTAFECNLYSRDCDSIERCRYKQLLRKEQECNKLYIQLKADEEYHKEEETNLRQIIKNKEERNIKLYKENEELKKELEAIYDDCKGCPTCNEALYNANLYAKECRELKQTLAEIKEIAEPYQMTIKKICGNCKKYDDCHACCYKDINCYKYTRAETNACEEFVYLDEFVPNILANNILQKISEVIPSEN